MAVAPIKEIPVQQNPLSFMEQFAQQVGRYDPITQTTTNTSPAAAANIEQLLAVLTGRATSGDYSKDAAFADSDAILAQIFRDFSEGTLPKIYQAASGTGGYNSSTAQLLANDAFARTVAAGQQAKLKAASDYAAAEAAKANAAVNAGRTAQNINPRTTQQQKMSPLSMAMGAGNLALKLAPFAFSKNANPALKVRREEFGSTIDAEDADVGSFMTSSGAGVAGPGSFSAAAGLGTPSGASSFQSVIDSELSSFADSSSNIFGSFSAGGGADFTSSIEAASGLGDFTGNAFDLSTGGAEAFSAFPSSVAESAVDLTTGVAGSAAENIFKTGFDAFDSVTGGFGGGIPVVGPLLNIAQGDVGGAVGTVAGSVIGNMIFPGVGGAIGGFLGDFLGGGSVVCTELLRQGKMSKELYALDIAFARKEMSITTLRGYRFWAIPFVKAMRKSESLSRIAALFAVSRARHISGERNLVGFLTRKTFEPICFIIGLFVSDPDYTILYTDQKINA